MVIDVIISIIIFAIGTIIFYINMLNKFVEKNKKKKSKKAKEIIEIKYLEVTHNIDKEKLLNKKMLMLFSLINAFIIALTFLIVMILPFAIIWQLIISFILFLGLIYSIYNILGQILKKKGFDK